MTSFLPQGYEKPTFNSKYYKTIQGNNTFRILSSAIVGWVDWENNKPVRTKEKPEHSFDPKKPVKHFWAFAIWDYRDKAIKVFEITQSGIQGSIMDLHSDANWGSPTEYDLTIKRSGEGMETEYSIVPIPPKPLHPEIAKLYAETKIELEQLFVGGDPFAPKSKQSIADEANPLMDPNLGPDNVNIDNTICEH